MQLRATSLLFHSNRVIPKLSLILIFLFLAHVSQAQIAVWDFAGLSSPATANATFFDPNLVTASGGNTIIRGAGAPASTASNSFRTQSFQNNGIAVSNTDYFQVKLTASFGNVLSLSTINARVGGTATFTASPGCSNQFAYSLDGINFTLIGSPLISTASPTQLPSIDVSGITALQNVPSSTTVYLRFYASGQTTTGGWGFISAATAGTPGLAIVGAVTSAGPQPTITTSGSNSAVSTTYGTASTNSSFDVAGTDMTAGILVTPPNGYEVYDYGLSGFANTTVIGAAGTIPSTTVFIRLKATATVAGSPYSGNVVLSSTGALPVNVPTAPGTVAPLMITTSGASATSKVYDGNTSCVITGATAVGIVNGDTISIGGGGFFDTKNVGTLKTVTPNLVAIGTNASSYMISQPTLTADITPLYLTINNPVAQSKVFDGTDDAVITGTLNGVISPDNVSLVGVGNFVSSAIGTAIQVIANCSLSGPDAGNYAVTQPTGLIADINPPGLTAQSISFTLNSPVTYGDAPITLNGTATSNLTVSYISSDPLVASISGNTLTILKDGSVTITASQPGDNTFYAPAPDVTQNLVINKKTLTVLNPLGNNKVYDRNNSASFSGTLDGVVSGDNVVLNPTGTFSQFTTGTGLTITSTATITGNDMSKYILDPVTGLVADITPKPLTLNNPTVANKIYDGTTTATLTGTLTGVISPDVVTVTLSAVFSDSAIGNGKSVSSTSILAGLDSSNYTLTQPQGLMANIYPVPTLTEDIVPQFIQGVNGTNVNRIPFAYRVSLHNLLPNATYKYYNTVVIASDAATSTGAGNIIFVNPSGFTRTTSASMTTAGGFNTFVSDANGDYTGWFVTEPSGNATRFLPGTDVFMRIQLNNGEGGNSIASRVTTTSSVKVINLVNTAGPNNGTGLRGNSNAIARNFVFAYDNNAGTGRPLSGSFVESDGTLNTTANSYASFYSANVDGVTGAYGLVIPNINANGVQRLEQRSLTDGSIVGCASQSTGIWPSGTNTVNPAGGTTALTITLTDAPLNTCVSTLNLKCFIQGYYINDNQDPNYQKMRPAVFNQIGAPFTATDCDTLTVELHDATFPYAIATGIPAFVGVMNTDGILACTFPPSAVGGSYYIAVKHRNALQTWSANPVTIASVNSFDFTNLSTPGPDTKSYGPNQFEVEPGIWAFISGDITDDGSSDNQDGAVDGFDYTKLDPLVINGDCGYYGADLNGDGCVDAFDYILLDPNIIIGYTINIPQ